MAMKELRGHAGADVGVPVQRAFAVLHDLDGYRDWYPEVVREVRVVDRGDDGHPARAQATLHLSYGPIVRDFHLLLDVTVDPPTHVHLTRIPHEPSDPERFSVAWHVREALVTRLELDLMAALSVPRLLPVSGIGDSIAKGFVGAAVRALS